MEKRKENSMRVNKRKIASLLLAGALVCSGTTPALAAPKSSASPSPTATVSTKPKSTQKPLDTTVDPNGIYHATLGFETESTYRSVYRYGHFDDKNRSKPEWKQIVSGTKGSYNYRTYPGTFKNAIIKGNGTYSVQLRNANYRYASTFKLLQVCTDIPNTGDIKFSDLQVTVNGQKKLSFKKVSLASSQDYTVLYAINDKKKDLADLGNRKRIVPPSYQNNSVVIKFKVSGFNYNKGEAVPTPTVEPTKTPDSTVAPTQKAKTTQKADADRSVQNTKKNSKDTEVITQEKQIGMGVVVIVAIAGILACLIIVNKRKR